MTALFFLTATASPTETCRAQQAGSPSSRQLFVLVSKVNFQELTSQPQQHLSLRVRGARTARLRALRKGKQVHPQKLHTGPRVPSYPCRGCSMKALAELRKTACLREFEVLEYAGKNCWRSFLWRPLGQRQPASEGGGLSSLGEVSNWRCQTSVRFKGHHTILMSHTVVGCGLSRNLDLKSSLTCYVSSLRGLSEPSFSLL